MAIAGSWLAGNITPAEYSGSTRWGTGINPIHGVRDNSGRPGGTKLALGGTDDDAMVPEEILGPAQWGYSAEDAAMFPGEDYRYVAVDHPNWDEPLASRGDRGGPGTYSHEVLDFPQWGPHGTDPEDPDAWPLPGWPGGSRLRAESAQAENELIHQIAVPTPGVSGGWLNKQHGAVLDGRDADPSQVMVNTSERQLRSHLDNTRATGRATDDLRTAIANRLTGMKAKLYGKSFGMGGGPGTPDMALVTQDLPYRPWFYRQGAMPPAEVHQWNELTAFEPVLRSLPSDAGDQVVTQEAGITPDDYGYSGGDYFG